MAERVGAQVQEVAAELAQGKNVWPVVEYSLRMLLAGPATIDALNDNAKRGLGLVAP